MLEYIPTLRSVGNYSNTERSAAFDLAGQFGQPASCCGLGPINPCSHTRAGQIGRNLIQVDGTALGPSRPPEPHAQQGAQGNDQQPSVHYQQQ